MKFWGVRLGSILAVLAFAFGLDFLMQGGLNQIVGRPILNDYFVTLAVLAGLYVTLSVSLNLINGITGQFSIGHAAFYMVGAYSSAVLSNLFYQPSGLVPEIWIILMTLAGAAAAALAGLVVGLPSLRLRGDYLAIVTLGFGEILRIITLNQQAIGGSYGYEIKDKYTALWLVVILAATCIAVCRNLLQSAHGLPFLAVREDEVAAGAMGVDLTRTKVSAFVLGSAFAGGAGALLAHHAGFINPDMFKMEVSFLILTMVVLGGTGSITGSAIAAMCLFILPESQRFLVGADGRPIELGGAAVVGILLALAVTVAGARWIQHNLHDNSKRLGANLGLVVGAFVAAFAFSAAANLVPFLANTKADTGQLRFVVLALALIVIMLLRPQGLMGHRELSLKKFFGQDPHAMGVKS